jgi:hypothetical protein
MEYTLIRLIGGRTCNSEQVRNIEEMGLRSSSRNEKVKKRLGSRARMNKHGVVIGRNRD